MKIDNKLKRNLNISLPKKDKSSQVKGSKDGFLEKLEQVHGQKMTAQLDELLELIDQQGEKLSQHRTFDEVVRYKKMISNFIEEAVNKMYHLNEDYSTVRGKIYTLVDTIDESLSELTEMVISDQAEQIDVLDKIGEIRGMLVDLYS